MKKIYGLAALAAAMTLASCSNNDEPNVNPGNTVTDGYLAIKIANVDTRSTVSGYAYGTDDENQVSNATLVFFDDKDNLIGITRQADVKNFTAQTTGGNIAATKTMVVPVTKITGKEASDCASVIVVLNSTDDIDDELAAKLDVDGVRGVVSEHYGTTTAGNFVMTNSVYNNGTKAVYAQSVAGKVFDTEAAALANDPVELYVERQVAKVKVTEADDLTVPDNLQLTIDGVKQTYAVDIVGYEIGNESSTAYALKNIDDITDATAWDGWNASTAFRSHWANAGGESKTLKQPKWNAFASTFTDYMLENVSSNAPAIMLAGKVYLVGDESKAGVTFCKIDGVKGYYTVDGVLAYVANKLKVAGYCVEDNEATEEGKAYRSIEESDLQLAAATDNNWYGSVVLKNAETTVYDAEHNVVENFSVGDYKVYKWDGGSCYYYVTIQTNSFNGVVRNHFYDLTVNSIANLGSPVFNPEKEVVPEKPTIDDGGDEPTWSMNATINVLQWATVSQGISFE